MSFRCGRLEFFTERSDTHLLASGCDIRTIQTLRGHRHLDTTMIYTHIEDALRTVESPLDTL